MNIEETAKALGNWLRENVGDEVEIITPQFERTEPLKYKWKPRTTYGFIDVVNNAPPEVLFGLGFRKWDTMNNIIRENQGATDINIPVINGEPNETINMKLGSNNVPTELIEPDEDIWLIPGEWYDIIPDKFEVTDIFGAPETFKNGVSDDDIRYGCLAFGIRRPVEAKE